LKEKPEKIESLERFQELVFILSSNLEEKEILVSERIAFLFSCL